MTIVIILGNVCYAHKGFPHDKALIIININKERLVVKREHYSSRNSDNFWKKES